MDIYIESIYIQYPYKVYGTLKIPLLERMQCITGNRVCLNSN